MTLSFFSYSKTWKLAEGTSVYLLWVLYLFFTCTCIWTEARSAEWKHGRGNCLKSLLIFGDLSFGDLKQGYLYWILTALQNIMYSVNPI